MDEALTHPSLVNLHPDIRHYERLEFLGDAVVQLIVTELLMEAFPAWPEGKLTKARSRLVSEEGLAPLAVALGLPALLRYPAGQDHIPAQPLVQSRLVESVVGAIFADAGLDAARAWARPLFAPRVNSADDLPDGDPKSTLQEWCQARGWSLPAYTLIERSGPEHALSFVVEVRLVDGRTARGTGSKLKDAEKDAAAKAIETYGLTRGA